ncbi:transporter [Secundilactobacillus oryzae JCM 18671]|uniref:Transporter n=2 Tax=Secundilactobacillus oryzae TaxID=1202668 RepID=A0A081BJS5_9LACO|nr:transporter [Secundilactobacillus oryzae JCM 18671]
MISNIPALANTTQDFVQKLANYSWFKNIDFTQYTDQIEKGASTYASSFLNRLTTSLGTIISTITSFAVVAITVPVMLFYMLKDGHKFLPTIKKMLPKHQADQTISVLEQMSNTISKYIGGQMIECLFVGTFTAIGYVLIGQKYALLLGVFAGACNIIPYVGPYIGILPALIVAFGDNMLQLVYVIIVVLVVQQVDGNVVYPNIIGKTLQIHPLTIIIILLAAGNIAGLMGMILAIPLYAVVKVIVQNIYHIAMIRSEESHAQENSK